MTNSAALTLGDTCGAVSLRPIARTSHSGASDTIVRRRPLGRHRQMAEPLGLAGRVGLVVEVAELGRGFPRWNIAARGRYGAVDNGPNGRVLAMLGRRYEVARNA
jgi:hypothetical protein